MSEIQTEALKGELNKTEAGEFDKIQALKKELNETVESGDFFKEFDQYTRKHNALDLYLGLWLENATSASNNWSIVSLVANDLKERSVYASIAAYLVNLKNELDEQCRLRDYPEPRIHPEITDDFFDWWWELPIPDKKKLDPVEILKALHQTSFVKALNKLNVDVLFLRDIRSNQPIVKDYVGNVLQLANRVCPTSLWNSYELKLARVIAEKMNI